MFNTSRPRRAAAPKTVRALRVEALEDRLTPAVAIQFDYSYDTSGFFNNPAAKSSLESAARDLIAPITSTLSAITPAGGNTFTAKFFNPADSQEVSKTNVVIPANTLLVYVGTQNLGSFQLGFGGFGGYSMFGSTDWQKTVATRGKDGFSPWGGSLTFNHAANWYFGSDVSGKQPGQADFYSSAVHELGHLLGFGTAPQFTSLINSNGQFTGQAAHTVFGGLPSLSPDRGHWADGTESQGQAVSMEPQADLNGGRVAYTQLDYAALKDIGWQIGGQTSTPTTPVTPTTPTNPSPPAPNSGNVINLSPPATNSDDNVSVNVDPILKPCTCPLCVGGTVNNAVAVAGPAGSVQLYTGGTGGSLTATGPRLQPFAGFTGTVRTAVADVNGDNTPDVILGTGPNGGSRIRVLDGKTFKDILPGFSAFEESFTGGVFVAAGDFNGDGKAEIVVTPDQGGGGRTKVIEVSGGSAKTLADFFGIDDKNFRGGARATVGDVTGDGTPDLVVAAGFGGGPRVAVFNGDSVTTGRPTKVVDDFFAFEPNLRNGVYVTVGDLNSDGREDLIFGAGPGGAPRVLAVSATTLLSSGTQVALLSPVANFFAGSTTEVGGVRVTAKDLDQDGKADLVTGSGAGGAKQVQVYRGTGSGLSAANTLVPFGDATPDGIYVG